MPYTDRSGDVWRVTMACQYPTHNQVQETNMHLMITGAGVGDSRGALSGQVDSLIAAAVQPLLSSACHYHGCQVSAAFTTPPWTPVRTTHITPGGGTTRFLPLNARPVIAFQTEMVGPFYRGRAYCFTPDDLQLAADSTVSVGYQNAWATLFDTFRAGLVVQGSTWQLVILHRKKHLDGSLYPPTPVQTVVRREKFGTQRRGGDYGKTNTLPW